MSDEEVKAVSARLGAARSEERVGLRYSTLRREKVRLDASAVEDLVYGSRELDGSATLPFVLQLGDGLPSFVAFSIEDFRIVSLKAITVRGELLTQAKTKATLTIFRRSTIRRIACRLTGRRAFVHGRLTSLEPAELTS